MAPNHSTVTRAAVSLALTLAVASAAAAQAPPHDQAALVELVAAYRHLSDLRSYRVRLGAAGQPPTTLLEVRNPDRYRVVTQSGGDATEVVVVGQEIRSRATGGRGGEEWKCTGKLPLLVEAFFIFKPKEDQTGVAVSRLGAVAVDGAAAQGYEIVSTSGPAVRARVYVLAEGGLPRRVEILEAPAVGGTVADFGDYDAPISIELPPCDA